MTKNVKIINSSQCYGCYACSNICPKGCISMAEDKDGFAIPKIKEEDCIKCGLCVQVCPAEKKYKNNNDFPLTVYAANVKDEDIRMKSTSGGMFYPIAEHVINKGGCVFGAAFNSSYEVIHIFAETISEVERCMKSKYVQSNMGNSYEEVAKRSQKQMILFTGTPCQIAALNKYPGLKMENVIAVDIICHGVPSPKLWKKYLKEMRDKYGKIIYLMTRSKKRYGSLQSETVIHFANGEKYHKVLDKDCYMDAFMNGLSLRERCYHCQYKGKNRFSDITIADFSSIRKYIKDADSFKGTSMLILNTEKGKQVIESLKDKFEMKKINTKEGLVEDWTWGLSYPYSVKHRMFYDNCFEKNYTIKKSLYHVRHDLKKVCLPGERIKEVCSEIRKKIQDCYYKYIFQLRG